MRIERKSWRGRMPGGYGLGPGGVCICLDCGKEVPHTRGVPCYALTCPYCGGPMMRKEVITRFQQRFVR